MALRQSPGKFARVFGGQEVRSRRVAAAFALGAALSAAGLAAFEANLASARGPFTAANPTSYAAPDRIYGATYSVAPAGQRITEEDAPRKRHRARITLIGGALSQGGGQYVGSQPVCVRLCDGFFFPLAAASGDPGAQAAACNSQCPDAPTEVYYRNASDRIEDAISSHGKSYTALPVSLRYRGAADNTCSCHRDAVAYAPLRDATLRRGDALMTPAGMVVFSGAEGAGHGPRDFVALSSAGLPVAQRSALQAMEKVSVNTVHPSLRDWMASQNAPALAAGSTPVLARAGDHIRLLTFGGAQN
jgi:hypothetical protein